MSISKFYCLLFLTYLALFNTVNSLSQSLDDHRSAHAIYGYADDNFRFDSIKMHKSIDTLRSMPGDVRIYPELLKAKYYSHNANKDKALQLLDSLIQEHQFVNDTLRPYCRLIKSQILMFRDTQKSLEIALALENKLSQINVSSLFQGDVHYTAGNGFSLSQNYSEGIDYYEKAEEYYKESGNDFDLSVVYNNLGNSFRRIDEKDAEVLDYYEKAIQFLDEDEHQHRINIIRQNLNIVKLSLGKKVSLGDIDQIEKYFKKSGDQRRLANTYKLKALYYKKRDEARASSYYEKALETISSQNNISKVDIMIDHIQFLCNTDQVKQAEKQLKLLDDLIEEYPHGTIRYHLADYYEQKAKIDSASGDTERALLYYQKSFKYADSIKDENYDALVASNKIKYETKQKELQLKKQKNQILGLQVEQERQKQLLTIFISLAVLLSFIAAIIYYFNRKINRKKAELEHSLQRNELLFNELQHRTKNNFEILSGLIDFEFRNAEDKNTLKNAIENKIINIARIHDQFHSAGRLEKIQADLFLENLAHQIADSHTQQKRQSIKFKIKGFDKLITNRLAIDLGLFTNEFIINAIKHSFDEERDYQIDIEATHQDNAFKRIIFSHNGTKPKNGNLDIRLLELIAMQSNCSMHIELAKEKFYIYLNFNQ